MDDSEKAHLFETVLERCMLEGLVPGRLTGGRILRPRHYRKLLEFSHNAFFHPRSDLLCPMPYWYCSLTIARSPVC